VGDENTCAHGAKECGDCFHHGNGPISQPSELTARGNTQSKELLSMPNFEASVMPGCNTLCSMEHVLDVSVQPDTILVPAVDAACPIPSRGGHISPHRGSARHRGPPVPSHLGQLLLAKLAINKADDECQHDLTPLFDPSLYRISRFQEFFAEP
jgi:hypothetical protein